MDAELMIYENEGHDSWTHTFARHDLYEWMLSRRVPPPPGGGRLDRTAGLRITYSLA